MGGTSRRKVYGTEGQGTKRKGNEERKVKLTRPPVHLVSLPQLPVPPTVHNNYCHFNYCLLCIFVRSFFI